jgi:hypothetical protein
MTLFGWTFDDWSAAFYYHPVQGEMTIAKAGQTRHAWMKRNLGASPGAATIELPFNVGPPSDPEAAAALFKLPLTSQAWRT